MKPKLLLFIPCLLGFILPVCAQEATSETGERMKEFYTRFPKSDFDKDGVLTLDEMYRYLDKKIKNGATSQVKAKRLVSSIYLREILEKTPGSDLNQDGVLTKEELLEFLRRKKAAPTVAVTEPFTP